MRRNADLDQRAHFFDPKDPSAHPKALVEVLKVHGIKNIVFHEWQGTSHEWLIWRRALSEIAPRHLK